MLDMNESIYDNFLALMDECDYEFESDRDKKYVACQAAMYYVFSGEYYLLNDGKTYFLESPTAKVLEHFINRGISILENTKAEMRAISAQDVKVGE